MSINLLYHPSRLKIHFSQQCREGYGLLKATEFPAVSEIPYKKEGNHL